MEHQTTIVTSLRPVITLLVTVAFGALCGFVIAFATVPLCLKFETLWETHSIRSSHPLEWGYVRMVSIFAGACSGAIGFPFSYFVIWKGLTKKQRNQATLETFVGTLGLAMLASPAMELFALFATLIGFIVMSFWIGQRVSERSERARREDSVRESIL